MADIQQRTLNSRIPPARILSCHADGEISDEQTVPSKNGVRSNQRRNFVESTPANSLATNRETAALIVGQSESFLAELLLEDSVLLPEILDDCVLLLADPASQGGDEDLPGL